MPLHHVLFFPCGDLGWHWALRLHNPDNIRKNDRITQRAFYHYMLHTKHNMNAFLFRGGKLFQQYLVDAWAACDQNKCDWTRTHQANLRADLYNGLADSMAREDGNAANLGRKIILPSSFISGDRFVLCVASSGIASLLLPGGRRLSLDSKFPSIFTKSLLAVRAKIQTWQIY